MNSLNLHCWRPLSCCTVELVTAFEILDRIVNRRYTFGRSMQQGRRIWILRLILNQLIWNQRIIKLMIASQGFKHANQFFSRWCLSWCEFFSSLVKYSMITYSITWQLFGGTKYVTDINCIPLQIQLQLNWTLNLKHRKLLKFRVRMSTALKGPN